MAVSYYRDSNGVLRNNFNGGEVMQRPLISHRELCPLPDTEHALDLRANPLRPGGKKCRHKFQDGRTAWKRRHFQIQGHPAEGVRCALCRLQVVMYYEEEV